MSAGRPRTITAQLATTSAACGHVRFPANPCRAHDSPPPRTNARTSFPNRDPSSGCVPVTCPPLRLSCPPIACVRYPACRRTSPPVGRSSPLSAPLHDLLTADGHLGSDLPPTGGHPDLPLGPVQSRPWLSRRHDQHFTNPWKSAFSLNPDQPETPRTQGAGRGSVGTPKAQEKRGECVWGGEEGGWWFAGRAKVVGWGGWSDKNYCYFAAGANSHFFMVRVSCETPENNIFLEKNRLKQLGAKIAHYLGGEM